MIYPITRRSVLIGAVGSLICAPAIVRAVSLMPVCSLPLQTLIPEEEFYRRCFYHSLDRGLRTCRLSPNINGKIVSVADALRMVAYWIGARRNSAPYHDSRLDILGVALAAQNKGLSTVANRKQAASRILTVATVQVARRGAIALV